MVMASAGVNMPGSDGVGNPTAASASATGCRMRRRRRLELPGSGDGAAGPSPAASPFPFPSSSSSSTPSPSQGPADRDDDDEQEEVDPEAQEMEIPAVGLQLPAADAEVVTAQVWPVAFGSVSMAGRMRIMEDTVSLHPAFCNWVDSSPMHFFAVFDGHGGSHVSALCRDRMHVLLAAELGREGATFLQRRQESSSGAGTSAAGASSSSGGAWSEQAEEERAWRAALLRSFRHMDTLAAVACACGRVARPPCRCPLSVNSSGIVGSTAVVAVLNRGRIVVANCGDSRAVLCRGPAGTPPVLLSFDHKPDRADEMARIEAVGGRVLFNNGARVRGILAMSRAIGDRMLRPEVIAEPEITITERTVEDQCLILASDGMWDVISNETACEVTRHCLEDGNPPPIDPAAATAAAGAPPAATVVGVQPRCLRAASLLARLAIGRETQDNISIIVVDLKHRE